MNIDRVKNTWVVRSFIEGLKGDNRDGEIMCINYLYHGSVCPKQNFRAMGINSSGNRYTIDFSLYISGFICRSIIFILPGFRVLPEGVEEYLHLFSASFIHPFIHSSNIHEALNVLYSTFG